MLAKLKGLRGTAFDIFGYHKDRKAERQLTKDYEADIALVLEKLSADNFDICAQLLVLPDDIRGYGPIKELNLEKAMQKRAELRALLENGLTNNQDARKAA